VRSALAQAHDGHDAALAGFVNHPVVVVPLIHCARFRGETPSVKRIEQRGNVGIRSDGLSRRATRAAARYGCRRRDGACSRRSRRPCGSRRPNGRPSRFAYSLLGTTPRRDWRLGWRNGLILGDGRRGPAFSWDGPMVPWSSARSVEAGNSRCCRASTTLLFANAWASMHGAANSISARTGTPAKFRATRTEVLRGQRYGSRSGERLRQAGEHGEVGVKLHASASMAPEWPGQL
jgi:hypothetical protein